MSHFLVPSRHIFVNTLFSNMPSVHSVRDFTTFRKNLLAVFMLWFCPPFFWQDLNVYLTIYSCIPLSQHSWDWRVARLSDSTYTDQSSYRSVTYFHVITKRLSFTNCYGANCRLSCRTHCCKPLIGHNVHLCSFSLFIGHCLKRPFALSLDDKHDCNLPFSLFIP
jgi:hypothetical protein